MRVYILHDGTEVTAEQIKKAFEEGKAVLRHTERDGQVTTLLALDGVRYDTRWCEPHNGTWATVPENLQDALDAAAADV